MILIDTSIWIDHLRTANVLLTQLLEKRQALTHPFVIGELALGNLRQRKVILTALQDLPHANLAHDDEVLRFIDQQALFGLGIGYIDAHLLASVKLTPEATVWTRDKRLLVAAEQLFLTAHL